MRITSGMFRLTTALTVVSLVAGPAFAPLAIAQPAVPGTADPGAADPPARVGRLARIVGAVSSHAADQSAWTQAALNYPVTSGDAFWTEPQAEADLEVGATHIALGSQTELDVSTIDDSTLAATQGQGETYLRLRDVPAGSVVRIATPRGVVTIAMAGRYAIAAGDTDHPTTVTVVEGAGHVGGGALSVNVGPHQTLSLTGSADFQSSVGPEQDDVFLRAQLDRERPASAAASVARYAPPPVVQQMTGADALADTGEWDRTSNYGEVWYPPVQRDWVPYRDGHWAWVAPWGWTWVDNAPWGFAPSHYGRWVEVNDRWGWEPVVVGAPVQETPCYAPALVSWVDVAAGAAVGVAAAAAVGWIPLGPREPYYPPYRASDRYIRRVNVNNVTNITNIHNVTNNRLVENFVNRRAATVVPAATMVASQPVAARVQPVQAQAFGANRASVQPPVRPTAATAGVTPAVARALNLSPVGAEPVRPPAPGPAIQPRQAGAVPLRGTSIPANPGVVPGAAPAAQPARPGAGLAGAAAVGGAAALGGAALLGRPAGQVAPQPPLTRPGETPTAPRGALPAAEPQGAGTAARRALPPVASQEAGPAARSALPPVAPQEAGPAARSALPPVAPQGAGPAARSVLPPVAPQGAGPAARSALPAVASQGAGPAARNALPPLATPRETARPAVPTGPAPTPTPTPQVGLARPSGPPPLSVPNAGPAGTASPRPATPAAPGLVGRPNAPGAPAGRAAAPPPTPGAIPRAAINQADRAGTVPAAPRPAQAPARPAPPPPAAVAPRQPTPPAPQRAQPPVAAAPQFRAAPPPHAAPPPAPAPAVRAPPVARPMPPPAAVRPAPPPRPAAPPAARPAPQKDPRHP